MEEQKNFPWELLPWAAVVLSVINLWRTIFMGFENVSMAVLAAIIGTVATLGAAVIGGAIALIGQWRQAKRDGKKIESISSSTSDMQPKVNEIKDSVQSMYPSIIKVEERSAKIDFIATAVDHFNRIKNNTSENSIKPEALLASMTKVLEEKSMLTVQHQLDTQAISHLTSENHELAQENAKLHLKISQLQTELQKERGAMQHEAPCEDWEPEL